MAAPELRDYRGRISVLAELKGGLAPSLNGWPGNQGTTASCSREKPLEYRENSGRDDSRERPAHIPQARALQHVLKAEAARPDATDRSPPAMQSPGVGPMGAWQSADADPPEDHRLEAPIRQVVAHQSVSCDVRLSRAVLRTNGRFQIPNAVTAGETAPINGAAALKAEARGGYTAGHYPPGGYPASRRSCNSGAAVARGPLHPFNEARIGVLKRTRRYAPRTEFLHLSGPPPPSDPEQALDLVPLAAQFHQGNEQQRNQRLFGPGVVVFYLRS